ncbi:MAG: hypothetical protein KBA61_00460 [Spirochaetes bacterium]|nr:hypothetical protein [Spirochaetota bacterium]
MQDKKAEEKKEEVREFSENPFDPDRMNPEGVMRHFFVDDIPIIPVVSRTGTLMGILRKEDMVSELSDLDRVRKQKIDQFIQKLLKKMTFDDLLPYITRHREFMVINIFGESQGKWTRLQLLEASEQGLHKKAPHDAERQRDDQAMEWMIYLVLEHIPRALYAMNNNGKTMFYNSHFEDYIVQTLGTDYEIGAIEKSLAAPDKNDFYYNENDEILFYNQDFGFYYEKVPMISRDQTAGFLVFCDRESNIPVTALTSKKNLKKQSLDDRLATIEKIILTESLKEHGNNPDKAASALKMKVTVLKAKARKYGLTLNKQAVKKKK